MTCSFVGFRTDSVTSVRVSVASAGVLALAGTRPAGARKPQGGAPLPPPMATSLKVLAQTQLRSPMGGKSFQQLLEQAPGQGRSQGGECAPLVFSGPPAGRRSAGTKTSAEATETLTEVTKPARKPTKKHVRTVGALLTIWAHQKNRAPVNIRGPSDSQSHHQ